MAVKIPSEMLAAVQEKFSEPYSVTKITTPSKPEGHDLLIRVLAASYCHTDAVFSSGEMQHNQTLPRVGCHEYSGEIVAFGPSAENLYGLTVGSKVGVPPLSYHPCTKCFECTRDDGDGSRYSPHCPYAETLGLTVDGGFQQYCLVDSRQIVPIPEGLTAVDTAPLMCAGFTIWGALQHERIKNASKIAIVGAGGGLGHLGIQFAAHLGKEVLAVDASDKSLELLQNVIKGLGSKGNQIKVGDARTTKPEDLLVSIGEHSSDAAPGELGVDAAILLADSQAAMDLATALLKNHGTIVVVSFPERGFNMSATALVFRDIRIVGSWVAKHWQLREMMQFANQYNVKPVVKTFSLPEINALVDEYHRGTGGKLVIDMTLDSLA
ncbi:putative alcohol dehydrogenase [Phaeomoniella chlamydospora]|uniref:Putative alcohol dehydrogenase n=1 Tax=Phaeomoniella chlamydospora TaxID=158046 RepID=A0A0G2GMU2_PHACM|nr:putative alcohol dehydrogenase [Phaeomoniella chlamydospora]